MKTILVVFAILLLLLTLLGAFGGSIQYAEPFFEDVSEPQEPPMNYEFPEQQSGMKSEFYNPPEPIQVESPAPTYQEFPDVPEFPVVSDENVYMSSPSSQETHEPFTIEPFEEDEKSSFPAAF